MPPKQVKKVKKPRRKTKKPTQTQTQKQVVNINFEKPKKKKRRKKSQPKQQFIPAISTMNMLSSDTARFDTLYNRLYDLQNQKGFPTPPPPPSPVSSQTQPLPLATSVAIATPFNVEMKTPIAPPVIKEPSVKVLNDVFNPPLLGSGRFGDVLDIFSGMFTSEEPSIAKVKKQKPPPNAPAIPVGTINMFNPIEPMRGDGIIFDDEEDEIPLNINRDKPVVTLIEPDEQAEQVEPQVSIVSQNNALLDQIRNPNFILQETGDQADLLPMNPANFDRNVDLQKLKDTLKKDIIRKEEEASRKKSQSFSPVVPLIAQNQDQVLIPYRPDEDQMYNIIDELVPSTNISREPVPSLVRGYEGLGAAEEPEPVSITELVGRPPRADKGVERGEYNTKGKRADNFRNQNLLKNIFGAWRTEVDSVAL